MGTLKEELLTYMAKAEGLAKEVDALQWWNNTHKPTFLVFCSSENLARATIFRRS